MGTPAKLITSELSPPMTLIMLKPANGHWTLLAVMLVHPGVPMKIVWIGGDGPARRQSLFRR